MTHAWSFACVPKSQNQMLRLHWKAQTNQKRLWKMEVLTLCGKGPWLKIKDFAPSKVKLGITMHRWCVQDPDNRPGSVKFLVDALKKLGWLYEDTEEWLDLHVFEEKCRRGEEKTEVVWQIL